MPIAGHATRTALDTNSCVLALDQGGRSSRAIAFDRSGRGLSTVTRRVVEQRPGEDRVEQDPEELVRSIEEAARDCVRFARKKGFVVAAAGLATQRSSLVCWDRSSGAALSPVLSWQDRRAARWLESLELDRDDVRARTGLVVSPHYGASKMRWCLDHLPAVRAARESGRLAIGPLASFLAFRLLKERPFVVDPANASRTLLWNVGTSDWDPVLCERFGIPLDVLPRCVPTRYAFGTFAGLPLEVLTGDQSAAAFALGEPRPDTVYVNIGTGAFVQRPIAANAPAPALPRLLHSVILREESRTLSVIEGTINGAGSAIERIGEELGVHPVALFDEMFLSNEALPLFLNGVSGLAAPFWSPSFRSRFIGEGTPYEKLAAVGESIVFLIRAILDEMATELPPPARVNLSGGMVVRDGLCQRIADVTSLAVDRNQMIEGTAIGLGRLLARRFDDDAEDRIDVLAPRANPALLERYARWSIELDRALRVDAR